MSRLPEGWRLVSLADSTAICTSGFWGLDDPALDTTPARVIRNGDVGKATRIATDLPVRHFSEKQLGKAGVRAGDVILVTSGAYTGNVARIRPSDAATPTIASNFVRLLRGGEGVDGEFLGHALAANSAQDQLATFKGGSAIPNLQVAAYDGVRLCIPPLAEQRKIAAILSSVDETIERTEAVIAQLDVVKKAMLEELLTRGIPGRHSRFKQTEIGEVPEEWVPEPLGNCIDLISGQHLLADDCDDDPRGTPYLTGPTDFPDGEVVVSKFTKAPKVMCEPGDVLVTVKGSGTGKLAKATGAYCISRQLMAARPRDCDGGFLYYLLSQATEELRAAASGLIPGIGRDQILGLQVKWPPRPEQQEIAGILGAVDHRIACEAREVGALRAAKAALSDSLLSGRVRVEPGEA